MDRIRVSLQLPVSTFSSLANKLREIHCQILLLKMIVNHKMLGQVVQEVDNAIHQINHYPVDSVVCFLFSLDSDLSRRWHYPAFEQLGPDD